MSASTITNKSAKLRLNRLDWDLLHAMSDGKRYTQQYLYDDVEELDEYGADWVRQRISHLYQNGLIEKVGTSTMYTISDYGIAALELEENIDEDTPPIEIGKMIREKVEK